MVASRSYNRSSVVRHLLVFFMSLFFCKNWTVAVHYKDVHLNCLLEQRWTGLRWTLYEPLGRKYRVEATGLLREKKKEKGNLIITA